MAKAAGEIIADPTKSFLDSGEKHPPTLSSKPPIHPKTPVDPPNDPPKLPVDPQKPPAVDPPKPPVNPQLPGFSGLTKLSTYTKNDVLLFGDHPSSIVCVVIIIISYHQLKIFVNAL